MNVENWRYGFEQYRGWGIGWTGYKEHLNFPHDPPTRIGDRLTGQWLAVHRNVDGKVERCLYASVPGSEGETQPGAMFDVEVQSGQVEVTDSTDLNIKIQECLKGLLRIRSLIDQVEESATSIA